jgi:hypothetical protein
MPTTSIRDVSEPLYESLKVAAAANKRSFVKEVIVALTGRKAVLFGLVACLFTAALPTTSAQTKNVLTLGTATPGGGFPVYGEAFAKIVNGAGTSLTIEPRNTKGSTENIPLLERASSISRWSLANPHLKLWQVSIGQPLIYALSQPCMQHPVCSLFVAIARIARLPI